MKRVSSHRSNAEDDDYFSNPLKHLDVTKLSSYKIRRSSTNRQSHHQPHSAAKKRKLKKEEDDIVETLDDCSPSDEERNLSAVSKLLKQCKGNKDQVATEDEIIVLEEEQPVAIEPIISAAGSKPNPTTHQHGRKKLRPEHVDLSLEVEEMSESPNVVQLLKEDDEIETVEHCMLDIRDIEQPSSDIAVSWKMTQNLRQLAAKFAAKWACEEECVHLSKAEGGGTVSLDKSPSELGFAAGTVIVLIADKLKEADSNCIQIVLQFDKYKLSKRIPKNAAFITLKSDLAKELGVEQSKIKLLFDGYNINDDETPQSLEIEEGEFIDVMYS